MGEVAKEHRICQEESIISELGLIKDGTVGSREDEMDWKQVMEDGV